MNKAIHGCGKSHYIVLDVHGLCQQRLQLRRDEITLSDAQELAVCLSCSCRPFHTLPTICCPLRWHSAYSVFICKFMYCIYEIFRLFFLLETHQAENWKIEPEK